MNYFWSNYKLCDTSLGIKLIVTFFTFIMVIGLLSNLAIFYSHTQFRTPAIAKYYLGAEEELIAPQSFRALVETTHFHVFSMPVVVMILAHLLLMTSVREGVKMSVILASFVGVILDIVSPWLVRYVAAQCAILMMLAQYLLAMSFLFYIIIPIYDMWFKKKETASVATATHPNPFAKAQPGGQ